MLRVCIALSFLSIAACISSPEVTLVDETQHASVSPDGSAERIALVEEAGLDAGDGGVLPHPERDSGTDARPAGDASASDDDDDDDDDGKGKGKPPKKKD